MRLVLSIAFLLFSALVLAQQGSITLNVKSEKGDVSKAQAFVDHTSEFYEANQSGSIQIKGIDTGSHVFSIFLEGHATQILTLRVGDDNSEVEVQMEDLGVDLDEFVIRDQRISGAGMSYMKYIQADGLYAAKKNEIILPEEMATNKASNNARQTFAKVPGINIQETDAGGLQLGIGARGLDPKRTSNFNTRQDGYDISADALGYPESYYTPPLEAIQSIELVRGAASLQYGTQFGGLLNFRMKEGPENRKLQLTGRATAGSFNFYNLFASAGGSTGEWNYYGFFQHKRGDGWRPNSHFTSNTAYGMARRNIGKRWSLSLALTHHQYLAQQPGGLTDRMFEEDPYQSVRDRNWFRVNWNIAALTFNGKLSKTLSINSKTFVLDAERSALGFLGNINRIDPGGNRDLIQGDFLNVGNETRLVKRFNRGEVPGAVLVGTRVYSGHTRNRQGLASDGDDADFKFLNPDRLEGSDYDFPSRNAAVFSEALIPVIGCWYLTPGIRFDHIVTQSDGYYLQQNRHPLTGELLYSQQQQGSSYSERNILLFGLGTTYRCFPDVEVYANWSQNYRALNFSDIRVNNPNLVIDPKMTDERGYTVDLGIRGKLKNGLVHFDIGYFLMQYRDRIGNILQVIENDQGVRRVVNYRTNIADARFQGLELFEELDFVKFFKDDAKWRIAWFNNLALINAIYQSTDEAAFEDKLVENVPAINYKTGIQVGSDRFKTNLQYNYVSEQYTDATNSEFFPDATVGLIPAYGVVDLSASYTYKRYTIEGSVNNALDNIYFTRRATGYPGPGIIPAERRMIFLTLEVKI